MVIGIFENIHYNTDEKALYDSAAGSLAGAMKLKPGEVTFFGGGKDPSKDDGSRHFLFPIEEGEDSRVFINNLNTAYPGANARYGADDSGRKGVVFDADPFMTSTIWNKINGTDQSKITIVSTGFQGVEWGAYQASELPSGVAGTDSASKSDKSTASDSKDAKGAKVDTGSIGEMLKNDSLAKKWADQIANGGVIPKADRDALIAFATQQLANKVEEGNKNTAKLKKDPEAFKKFAAEYEDIDNNLVLLNKTQGDDTAAKSAGTTVSDDDYNKAVDRLRHLPTDSLTQEQRTQAITDATLVDKHIKAELDDMTLSDAKVLQLRAEQKSNGELLKAMQDQDAKHPNAPTPKEEMDPISKLITALISAFTGKSFSDSVPGDKTTKASADDLTKFNTELDKYNQALADNGFADKQLGTKEIESLKAKAAQWPAVTVTQETHELQKSQANLVQLKAAPNRDLAFALSLEQGHLKEMADGHDNLASLKQRHGYDYAGELAKFEKMTSPDASSNGAKLAHLTGGDGKTQMIAQFVKVSKGQFTLGDLGTFSPGAGGKGKPKSSLTEV